MAGMQVLEARLASFAVVKKPKSRAKPAFALSVETHPNLTPDALAAAGFYHVASSSSTLNDTVCCFLCDLKLGGWDEDDDPYEEHEKRGRCAWAEIVCALKVDKMRNGSEHGGRFRSVYPTPESHPASATSSEVREQTFKNWWPYEERDDWLPSVKNLAKAGFIYTPSSTCNDNVTCPLCEYSVEGWEATDDPMTIHQKKYPDCRFFTATVQLPEPEPEASDIAGPSKSSRRTTKSQPSKKSKRAAAAAATAVEEPESQLETAAEIQVTESQPLTKSTRGTRKTAAAAAAKPSAASRRKTKAAPAEVEVEEDTNVVVEETAVVAVEEMEEAAETAEEIEVDPETKGRKGRSKAKPKKASGKTKTKGKKTGKQSVEEEEVEMEETVEDVTPKQDVVLVSPIVPPPKSVSSKSQSQTQPQTQSSKSTSRSTKEPPTSQQLPQSRPLSQLERFANIPTSPQTSQSQPKQKSPLPNHPSRNNPIPKSNIITTLSRENLNKSLNQGAEEARKVIENLSESHEEEEVRIQLSDEQKGMTLEELIRLEMRRRYEEMEREGEEMIRLWERRTMEARKRIEMV